MNRDEGREVPGTMKGMICKCCKELGVASDETRRLIKMSCDGNDGRIVSIYMVDKNEFVDCIPYVLCFTTLKMNDGEKGAKYITERDIAIQFLSLSDPSVDLVVPENIRDPTREFFRMERVDYQADDLTDEIWKSVVWIIKRYTLGQTSLERTAELLSHVLNHERLRRLPRIHIHEQETRLIVYVPLDIDEHQDIMRYAIKDDEARGADNEYDEYIYLRLKEKESFYIIANKGARAEYYRQLITDAGYKPVVDEIEMMRGGIESSWRRPPGA